MQCLNLRTLVVGALRERLHTVCTRLRVRITQHSLTKCKLGRVREFVIDSTGSINASATLYIQSAELRVHCGLFVDGVYWHHEELTYLSESSLCPLGCAWFPRGGAAWSG